MEVRILRPGSNWVVLRFPNVIDFEVSYDHVELNEYIPRRNGPRRNGLICFTADLSHIPIMDFQQALGIHDLEYRTLTLNHGDHEHAFDRCLCVSINYNYSDNNVNYTGCFQWQFRGSAFMFDEALNTDLGTVQPNRTWHAASRGLSQELDWRRFGF